MMLFPPGVTDFWLPYTVAEHAWPLTIWLVALSSCRFFSPLKICTWKMDDVVAPCSEQNDGRSSSLPPQLVHFSTCRPCHWQCIVGGDVYFLGPMQPAIWPRNSGTGSWSACLSPMFSLYSHRSTPSCVLYQMYDAWWCPSSGPAQMCVFSSHIVTGSWTSNASTVSHAC